MRKSRNIERASQNDVTDKENRPEADTSHREDAFQNEITGDEAEKIIRSFGQHTTHLWPHCFPAYSSEFVDQQSVAGHAGTWALHAR